MLLDILLILSLLTFSNFWDCVMAYIAYFQPNIEAFRNNDKNNNNNNNNGYDKKLVTMIEWVNEYLLKQML